MKKRWTIGTRGSALALRQTHIVIQELQPHYPECEFVIKTIRTTGDTVWDRPLHLVGGKGLFVKEIEDKLLEGEIDMAVHSVKDLPADLAGNLLIGAVLKREDPRDAFLSLSCKSLRAAENGSRIGTSSLRRTAQLLRQNNTLEIVPLRGNIETRIAKLRTEGLDGIILACAGIKRMGLEEHIREILPIDTMVPSCGQGAIGIEIADSEEARELAASINDEQSHREISIERSLLAKIGGGCHLPLGIHASIDKDNLTLHISMGEETGRELFIHESHSGSANNADLLIDEVYSKLKQSLN